MARDYRTVDDLDDDEYRDYEKNPDRYEDVTENTYNDIDDMMYPDEDSRLVEDEDW